MELFYRQNMSMRQRILHSLSCRTTDDALFCTQHKHGFHFWVQCRNSQGKDWCLFSLSTNIQSRRRNLEFVFHWAYQYHVGLRSLLFFASLLLRSVFSLWSWSALEPQGETIGPYTTYRFQTLLIVLLFIFTPCLRRLYICCARICISYWFRIRIPSHELRSFVSSPSAPVVQYLPAPDPQSNAYWKLSSARACP